MLCIPWEKGFWGYSRQRMTRLACTFETINQNLRCSRTVYSMTAIMSARTGPGLNIYSRHVLSFQDTCVHKTISRGTHKNWAIFWRNPTQLTIHANRDGSYQLGIMQSEQGPSDFCFHYRSTIALRTDSEGPDQSCAYDRLIRVFLSLLMIDIYDGFPVSLLL